jgi:hypothetical protein
MAGRIAYYGNTVTNGLVLSLDAAKRDSYPGSGTAWRDISGNGNNGTLTNGPTYTSDNGGAIVFDGVDDYTALPVGSIVDAITMLFWVSGSYQNYKLSLYERSTNTGTGLSTGIPNNGWVQLGYSAVSGSTGQFIINGIVYNPDTGGSFPYDVPTAKPIMWMGGFNYFGSISGPNLSFHLQVSSGGLINFKWGHNFPYKAIGITATLAGRRYFTGGISNTQIYNRALSATEVLQNYNAQKPRYGL